MAQLTINLLGTPQIKVDNQRIEIGRRKAVALLAYLAVTGQAHGRDALAALLWPESSAQRANASLRSALWALNKTPLAEWLQVDGDTTRLSTDVLTVDVVRFREALAAPRAHSHPAAELCADCVDAVNEAVNLYRGDFMAGFTLPDAPPFDEWQFFQASELRESLASALDRLLRFYSAAHEIERAIDLGRRLVTLDPLHEPAHRTLIQLYADAGQQSAALRQYQICRDMLNDELAVEPSAETEAVMEQIRKAPRSSGSNLPPKGQPSPAEPPHNLPPDPTPLIGRGEDLQRIAAFLTNPQKRLITIVGPGGIGKTRLALAAARTALTDTHVADGVYFVQLAAVGEPEAMLSLIAETVGYPLQNDSRSSAQQLLDYLRQKSMLLVLDNFEHLLDGAAFVADLLKAAPQVSVLATSRERLNLYEEQQFLLGGLAVPPDETAETDTNYPAATLFIESARRRRPDFALTPTDGPHLANICRLVEGMPLGLELAAAWVEMLSLPQISAEIQHNLDFLETSMRNVPARHRSMRAVFDASWERLTPAEQQAYAQLTFFRGGFTAEAARVVTNASLPILASLVNQSLLRTVPGSGRYDIHELLLQYAANKLAASDTAANEPRARHATYFCTFLQEREIDLKGVRQQEALSEIELELENIDVAWRWAVAQGEIKLQTISLETMSLVYLWHGRLREGHALCRLAIKQLENTPATTDDPAQAYLLLRLLIWQADFDRTSAHYDIASRALQQAQQMLDSPALQQTDTRAEKAALLLRLSEIANVRTFGGDALNLNQQSLALYRTIDDKWGIMQALFALAVKQQNIGNYELAVELQRECLTISEQQGDPRSIALSYSGLGHYILFAGWPAESERYLRTSLALFQELGMRADQRRPLLILGINLTFNGKFQESIESFEACWAIHRGLAIPHEPGAASVGIVRAHINLGQYDEARKRAERNLKRYRTLNHKWYIAFSCFNLGRIALVEGAVEQAQACFAESAHIFLEMNDRPVAPDVLFCQALAYRLQGQRDEALQSLIAGLHIALESDPLSPMRFELPAMALLCLDAGEVERAVELYAAARQSPYIANSVWFETIAGQAVARAAATLPQDVATAAEARGQARELLATARALLDELASLSDHDG